MNAPTFCRIRVTTYDIWAMVYSEMIMSHVTCDRYCCCRTEIPDDQGNRKRIWLAWCIVCALPWTITAVEFILCRDENKCMDHLKGESVLMCFIVALEALDGCQLRKRRSERALCERNEIRMQSSMKANVWLHHQESAESRKRLLSFTIQYSYIISDIFIHLCFMYGWCATWIITFTESLSLTTFFHFMLLRS